MCSLLLCACEDDITIDIIREEPRLVLHAYFEKQKPMTVDLERSIPLTIQVNDDRSSYQIADAEVKVYENKKMLATMVRDNIE